MNWEIINTNSFKNCKSLEDLLSLRFDQDNSKFISIFYKLLKGEASAEEIEFSKKYAENYSPTQYIIKD